MRQLILHIFILLFVLAGNLNYAQKITGDKYYDKLEYAEAIKYYKKDYDKSGDRSCLERLAECYHKTKQYEIALSSYEQLEKSGVLTTAQLFSIAQLYYENEQPEKGKSYFEKYAAASGSKWWERMMSGNSTLKEEDNEYYLINLQYLNTAFSEFSPSVIKGEIVFTSDRPINSIPTQTYGGTQTSFLNIFTTSGFTIKDSTFNVKVYYPKSEITAHAGPAVWDSINSVMYFSFVNDYEKNKVNKSAILKSFREGKKWTKPVSIGLDDPAYSFGHPCWVADLNILVFSSDKENGKGGKDLYYTQWNGSGWETPVQIQAVNTPGDELFPSIRKMADGKHKLYFSSDGFPGKGGLDFFSINFDLPLSDTTITWHKALSSSHDDFGIHFDKNNQGYFSSDRNGGKGHDDIYYFMENPNAFVICLTELNNAAAAGKTVAVKKDSEVLGTYTTDENGCLHLNKLPEGANALQILDNGTTDLKMKSFSSGAMNKDKMVVLDNGGRVLTELIYEDGNIIEQKIRTVHLTDITSGLPAKGLRIIVKSVNGEIVETIFTDENGQAVLKKIPPGEKFILAVDADEISLNPSLKKSDPNNLVIQDLIGKPVDSISTTNTEIRLSVLKIKTLDVCLYNQVTGEPLAHYKLTLRADDGTPIDTVITDANGCYRFKKLPTGNSLLTIENYDGGAITTRINGMKDAGITSLTIEGKEGKIIQVMDENGMVTSKTFCVYDKTSGQPVKEMLVHLADEKLQILDSVRTGADGCFTYKKLDDKNRNLVLMMAADEAEFFVKSKGNKSEFTSFYATYNNQTVLLDSISSNESDFSVGIIQKMIMAGCLTSRKDGSPLAFTKVYFRDEKGNKTDSVTTDRNGCFDYKKLGGNISDLQVMNTSDSPFEFRLNKSNSNVPSKLAVSDQNNQLVQNIDPVLNTKIKNENSLICFYDNLSGAPLAGMKAEVSDGVSSVVHLTSSQGCIDAAFVNEGKYTISIHAMTEKPILTTPASANGFGLVVKAGNHTVSGTYPVGKEIIVHLQKPEYVTASFVGADGKPVGGLPVEWYEATTNTWTLIPTEGNGQSKHVLDKSPGDINIRVKDSDDSYSFSTENNAASGNVKIKDNEGNLIATTELNSKKSFNVIVRPMGNDKGEINITGILSSVGNPVGGATLYIKTEEGVLVQRTTTDRLGNYYFKKLPSSSMLLEVDTSDIRMKFKSRVELNGNVTHTSSGKKSSGTEIVLGDGTGLKLEIQKTDENGDFSFQVNLDKIYSGIKNSNDNPWKNLSEGELKEITLNTIYFDYDKWNITFESERELDKVVAFLKSQPTASLNIKAHTDARGGDDYNMLLSRKRARSVMNYFAERSIDTMRLMSFGYGETQLINSCNNNATCSDVLHKKNRRIEFEIFWNGTSHNTQTASPLITEVKTIVDPKSDNTSIQTSNTSQTSLPVSESGKWYKVQISTSGKLMACTKENFKGLENVEYYIDNGIYKYTIGKFATKEEAISYRKNVINLYPQAFPVLLDNGVRVK